MPPVDALSRTPHPSRIAFDLAVKNTFGNIRLKYSPEHVLHTAAVSFFIFLCVLHVPALPKAASCTRNYLASETHIWAHNKIGKKLTQILVVDGVRKISQGVQYSIRHL